MLDSDWVNLCCKGDAAAMTKQRRFAALITSLLDVHESPLRTTVTCMLGAPSDQPLKAVLVNAGLHLRDSLSG